MRAIILGSQSFFDSDSKVGIQYIAEGLARNGWQVDYITNASSLVDCFSRTRRPRFKRIWLEGQEKGFEVSPGLPNLKEYGFKTFYPTRKEVLRSDWQIRLYPSLMPGLLSGHEYDVCIHDSSNTILFLPKIKAKRFVYRLNDLPSGFSFAIHPNLIKMFDRTLSGGRYDEIWAVSSPLAEYATSLNKNNRVTIIPNGVNIGCASAVSPAVPKKDRSAVFVGSILPWVDLSLVDGAAMRLPNWGIDFWGPLHMEWKVKAPNVRYRGVLERNKLFQTLRQYCVGLIPFRDVANRIYTVERPLKFYEYISAGLGVASTDAGALKKGMGSWAAYGNTPESYANAIIEAYGSASNRDTERVSEFLKDNSWDSVTAMITGRLEELLKSKEAGHRRTGKGLFCE